MVGMEKKRGKTLVEMCMWEGGDVGGREYSWSPVWREPAACVAQKIANSQQGNVLWIEGFKERDLASYKTQIFK